MRKLNVMLRRDAEHSEPVGQLVDTGGSVFFEYDPAFLRHPLWLSPFKLPPKPGLCEHTDRAFGPIFGLFEDSLPDGWGLLLMDCVFRGAGLDPRRISILDRLAYLGSDTMGALTYEPALDRGSTPDPDLDLHLLARESRRILAGSVDEVLPLLQRAGGSPGGARPKVLVGVRGESLVSGEGEIPEGYAHWMIKFAGSNDFPDAGPVEYAYARMAGAAGITMPETRLFSAREDRFFGVQRFDRLGNRRFHVHTFGNLIHSNFRIPACDYEDFFKVIRILTRDQQDVAQGFRRMVFNVLAHNRDDHVKNFSFLMNDEGAWRLAPAYDLIHAPGPGGEHSMTVLGEGRNPGRGEVFSLGRKAGLKDREMAEICDHVREAVGKWELWADEGGVSAKTTAMLKRAFDAVARVF